MKFEKMSVEDAAKVPVNNFRPVPPPPKTTEKDGEKYYFYTFAVAKRLFAIAKGGEIIFLPFATAKSVEQEGLH